MNKQDLIDFTEEIVSLFEAGKIHAPIHLHSGAEDDLIEVFKDVRDEDWVFGTHRSMYHALLKGVPRWMVKEEILKGNSICLNFPEYNFYTSAIVGGILPIALGVAMGIKRRGGKNRVWAFMGDMAAATGIYHDCFFYAAGFGFPITFVIEDNGLSVNSPTGVVWGRDSDNYAVNRCFKYERVCPHQGIGKWISF